MTADGPGPGPEGPDRRPLEGSGPGGGASRHRGTPGADSGASPDGPPALADHDVAWEVSERPLEDHEVRKVVDAALAHGGRRGARLSVAFVDDPTLAQLHEQTLGDPSVTDVMSFELGEEGGGPCGEVIVSVDRAHAVATQRGVPIARELALYVVHGTLHLCGYDDHGEADRARMRAAESEILRGLGFPPDDAPHDSAD